MRKDIYFYEQNSMETCGPACMLMILDLYGKLDPFGKLEYPTPKQEERLYYLCQSKAFRGVNGAEIANYLSKKGLSVHLAHSSSQMMDNRDGYFPEELFIKLLAEYQTGVDKCADRIRISTGADITCDTLRQELDEERQIILETIIPGDADGIHDHVLHWILVYGYEGDVFEACDPLSSKIKLTTAELENYMDTPIGKIYISVGEK